MYNILSLIYLNETKGSYKTVSIFTSSQWADIQASG